jgi:hypothetical protein
MDVTNAKVVQKLGDSRVEAKAMPSLVIVGCSEFRNLLSKS